MVYAQVIHRLTHNNSKGLGRKPKCTLPHQMIPNIAPNNKPITIRANHISPL